MEFYLNTPQKILVIPDTQVKEDVDTSHLKWISNYIVAKQPDIVLHLGDHWDMPSLSLYDVGKKTFEGKRYKKDIEAGNKGMALLTSTLIDYNKKQKQNGKKQYRPDLIYLSGNHDWRIHRAVNDDPKLDGTIGLSDRDLTGWNHVPFLEPCIINDVAFCHYFVTGVAGRPAATAAAQLRRTNMSCVAGHQQGKQVAYAPRADGSQITSIITGSCYLHDEEYMNVQGNKHWRGVVMLHEVENGHFDEMFVSLKFLGEKYS